MKDSTVFPAQDIYYPPDQQPDKRLHQYSLKWRQRQLLVKLSEQAKRPQMLSLKSKQRLVECLNHSPVRLLRVDSRLGEAELRFWADACHQAKKPLFLQIPATRKLPSKRYPFRWWLKRLIDWIASATLLMVLSPVMLGVILLMGIYSPGQVFFQQWRVGERGKIFRVLKFRTMVVDAKKLHNEVIDNQKGLHEHDPRLMPLWRWMRKHRLDKLPQLFNVLRGEMSIVGPRPWTIYDAVHLGSEGQSWLNVLPGITGVSQAQPRSTLLELDATNNCDLEYLRNWSLGRDLNVLLMTISKAILGFGAY